MNIIKIKKNNKETNIILNKGELSNKARHTIYPVKEWYNNAFFYNKNNIKNLPVLEINTIKILKWYFNMFNKNIEKSIKIRGKSIFRRRLKLNKIFMGKPEFKHTNDKLVINLYIYNRELIILNRKLKKIRRKLLAQYLFKIIVNNKIIFNKITYIKNIMIKLDNILFKLNNLNNRKKDYLSKLRKYNNNKIYQSKFWKTKNFKNLISKYIYILVKLSDKWNLYKNIKENTTKSKIRIIKAIKRIEIILKKGKLINTIKVKNKFGNIRTKFIRKPLKKKSYKVLYFLHKLISKDSFSNKLFKYLNTYVNKKYNFKVSKLMYFDILKKTIYRMKLYLRHLKLIHFNKMKFNIYILSLKTFLTKIFKKSVEINIINLKNFNLDSNILTDVMTIKLRNRKNRIMKIIDKVLANIRLPLTKRLDYVKEISRKKNLQNFIIKNYLNLEGYKVLPKINKLHLYKQNEDKLDEILKYSYPQQYNFIKSDNYLVKRNTENSVLDFIKYKVITGIRIEASGRLTKRLIASRAIFNMKQKGTIRNINSSYRKIPTVLLRGNLKSNLQYTHTNNKTRIGAFGLKGWLSSI